MSKYYVTFEAVVRQTIEVEADDRDQVMEEAIEQGSDPDNWEIAKGTSHVIDVELIKEEENHD